MEELEPLANFTQHTRCDEHFALAQLELLEDVERFADREIHVLRDAATLHAHRQTLWLEPFAFARRTLTQRPEWLQILLHRPRAFLIAPSQGWTHTFEVASER